uniref:Btz domain-containing protein n=1 Tax=Parastrongyloides trichosuri TaxID=131310 RepID=A0A0N4ZS06_PARTI
MSQESEIINSNVEDVPTNNEDLDVKNDCGKEDNNDKNTIPLFPITKTTPNNTTPEDNPIIFVTKLEEYENLFKNRYSKEDEGYAYDSEKGITTPYINHNYGRPRFDNRGNNRYQNDRRNDRRNNGNFERRRYNNDDREDDRRRYDNDRRR